MRTRILALILAGTVLAIASTSPAFAADTDAAAERASIDHINAERRERGLDTLVWNDRMAGIARQHSYEMAREDDLHHNSNLPNEVGDYAALGENVGYGPSEDNIHDAFMDSDSHRANILGSQYTQVGIGAVRDGEIVWITQVFFTPRSSSGGGPGGGSSTPSGDPGSGSGSDQRSWTDSAERVRAQSGAVTPVKPRPAPKARARTPSPVRASRSASIVQQIVSTDGFDQPSTPPGLMPQPRSTMFV